jgi:hypothetical protein
MEVYLNEISGIGDALVAMRESKRHITRDDELNIRTLEKMCIAEPPLGTRGFIKRKITSEEAERMSDIIDDVAAYNMQLDEFYTEVAKMLKWAKKHITLGKFIDLSFTVYGMHRGGQDDWDSHAKRFDNRIVRSSTRLADFHDGEMSDFYKNKILTTDAVAHKLNIHMPEGIDIDGFKYVKAVNGYIREEFADNKDVKRGLYNLSIPSDFIFRVNLIEFAHIYQQRHMGTSAHPEVKELAERAAGLVAYATADLVTKDWLLEVEN